MLRTDFPVRFADTLKVGENVQTVKTNTLNRDGAIRSAIAGLSSPRDEDKEVLASGLLGAKIGESKTFDDMLSVWDERQENEVVN